MTWISLVCLLVLSGSAFGGYGSNYGGPSVGQVPKIMTLIRDRPAPRPVISQGYGQVQQPQPVDWSSNVQQDLSIPQPVPTVSYGSVLTRTLPTQSYGQSYGGMPIVPQFDQPIPQVQPLSPADQLCRGQRPETVIPIEDNRKFVVCLDDSKGVEQECPKGLFYHPTSLRCERKLGPLENVCASQPCLNGGQCVPTETSYQCQCAPGFDGRTCELDARVCQMQYPCGQSADAKCQSFRLGAALQYICIFQDGYAYGLSTTQVVPSPCRDIDGPQALSVSRNGFIMCDGERMHIESCPGGTLWDDLNKACVWPDMEFIPQQDQSGYGQSSYGQQRPKLIQSGYGAPMEVVRTQPRHHHHHHHTKSFGGYGNKMIIPQQFELPKSTYGAPIEQPKLVQPTYGAQWTVPKFEQPKLVQPTYGAPLEQPKFIQPTYGAPLEQPKFEKPRLIQPTYGAPLELPKLEKPRLIESSYGAPLEQPKFEKPRLIESSYGTQQVQPQADIVSIKQTSAY